MCKTFRYSMSLSVLLAALLACQPSSDKDHSVRQTSSIKGAKETAPSKGESTAAPTVSTPRTENAASPPSQHATQQQPVAPTHSHVATHAKAKALAKAVSQSADKPKNPTKSGYASDGEMGETR